MIAHPSLAAVGLILSLSLASASSVLAQAPASAAAPEAAARHVELAAPDGRKIDVSVWDAAEPRAVVVFSHGMGGEPAAYGRLLSEWVADGFTVVAPLHVDSMAHPDRADFDGRAGFGARIADLAVTRGYVKATQGGRPMVVAGHSYGSLMSMIQAGAVTAAGPMGDPAVKAVIGLSSAGNLPGLITPETYAAVTTPTLILTGDRDTVPGFVTDWRDHRAAFDGSPAGDKMLVVYEGGDHSLVRDADTGDFALMVAVTTDFIEAEALGDAEAEARLAALVAPAGVAIERR